jgi:hypothetical protein
MTMPRWDFLLLATLAATPALGQNATPATGQAHDATPSSAPVPDMSGTWGHPFLTGGLEPPLSGPVR